MQYERMQPISLAKGQILMIFRCSSPGILPTSASSSVNGTSDQQPRSSSPSSPSSSSPWATKPSDLSPAATNKLSITASALPPVSSRLFAPILCTAITHMKPQDKRKQNVALYPLALSENCLGDNLQNRTVAKSCREVLMVLLLNRLPSCQGNPSNKPTNAPTSSRPSCMLYRTFTPLCSCKFLITPSWERAASLTKTGLSS